MTVEIISWSISTKIWDQAGIELPYVSELFLCVECTSTMAPKTSTGAIIRSLPYAKRALFEIGLIVKFRNTIGNKTPCRCTDNVSISNQYWCLKHIQRLVRKTKFPKLKLHADCMNFYDITKFSESLFTFNNDTLYWTKLKTLHYNSLYFVRKCWTESIYWSLIMFLRHPANGSSKLNQFVSFNDMLLQVFKALFTEFCYCACAN